MMTYKVAIRQEAENNASLINDRYTYMYKGFDLDMLYSTPLHYVNPVLHVSHMY